MQRHEAGLDLAVDLAERVAGAALLPVEGRVEAVLDGSPAEPLDGASGEAVALGEFGVGQRRGAVGLVGTQEYEGALDGLGSGAAAGDEGFEVAALVVGEGDAVVLGQGSAQKVEPT